MSETRESRFENRDKRRKANLVLIKYGICRSLAIRRIHMDDDERIFRFVRRKITCEPFMIERFFVICRPACLSCARFARYFVRKKWFAGYFPADKPKYALVVVHMDTPDSKAATNAVFYDIVKKVYEIEKNQT